MANQIAFMGALTAPTQAAARPGASRARTPRRAGAVHLGASARIADRSVVRLTARRTEASRGGLRVMAIGMPPGMPGGLGNMDPEKMKQLQAAYEKAMKDPETAKKVNEQMAQMQNMMKNPAVQQQMEAMNNMVANKDMQQRIAALKDDPEMKDFFADIQKNGPSAMMKYYSDKAFLQKLNDKLGGEEAIKAAVMGGGAAPPAAAAPAPPPEVETLHDAARYGDTEAVEDLLAVGKDINSRDTSQRTPIHYSIAFGKEEAGEQIFKMLLEGGADLTAVDEKQNTPLHYACGYGKVFAVEALLEAGSDITAKNSTGKTPMDLVKLEPKNPINEMPEILEKLTV